MKGTGVGYVDLLLYLADVNCYALWYMYIVNALGFLSQEGKKVDYKYQFVCLETKLRKIFLQTHFYLNLSCYYNTL